MKNKLIYLIGSLRNPSVPAVANELRDIGFNVFDDWHAAGPYADDHWRAYEKGRGRTMQQALAGKAARNVFNFDHHWLSAASAVVLLTPAGKSAHLELGWCLGRKVPGFIYLSLIHISEPTRPY